MKDEEADEALAFLAGAAANLLDAIDSEDIAIDVGNSKLSFGEIRDLMNGLMCAILPYEDLLEDDAPVDTALVSATRN